jgi:hypothetical protein
LSGALPGYPQQNVFTILDLTVNNPRLIERPVDMQVQQTPTSPLYVFAPRVFFSRDCTVAMIVAANKLGPSKNILQLVDLTTGTNIGTEVPFETAVFGALIRSLAAKQEVVVTVDTGSPTATSVVYPVP